MKIDAITAMAAGITLVTILGCQLLFFWAQDRRSRWLVWLAAPFAFAAVGMTLIVWRWKSPDYLGFGVGNGLILTAFGFIWQAVLVFERRHLRLSWVFAATATWLALALWPPFVESMMIRTAAISVGVGTFCALMARTLWEGRGEALPSRLPATVVMSSYACLMAVRVGVLGLLPYPLGGLPMQPLAVGIHNVIVLSHIAAFAVLMISMTKERREVEQRNYAMTDPLTGLLNRRAFSAQSQRIIYRRKFGREQTSLLVLDLDHFKAVNDRFGHDAGDRVLLRFAQIAAGTLRPTDALYRLGGEEFCFVLPDTPLAGAIALAERIRRTLEATRVDVDGEEAQVTVSIGIATTDFAGFDLEVLLAAADAALYEAKTRGRNRIVVAEPTSIPRPSDRSVVDPLRRAG